MKGPFRILIVCTGNSCRSPIAEALLRKRLEESHLAANVEVLSAGTVAVGGMPASMGAIQSVKKRDALLDGFRSRILSPDLCEDSHLLLVMEHEHRYFIEELYPASADKVLLLGSFLPHQFDDEIPDPVGGDQKLFDEIADLIDVAINGLIKEWKSLEERFFMNTMVIAIGADHRGFRIKEFVKQILVGDGIQWIDCGTNSEQSCDHPDFAFKVGELVSARKSDRGILICSTGHGMALSANKVPGVRAILPINEEHAVLSRTHNNANVLVLASDFMQRDDIERIVKTWLATQFLGGKYQRRIKKISEYERHVRS
ncbi:MAG: RpiB/LacA/LacB family sugar-phosphate isomerase [Candidatus Omnitrophota bacterium]|jgi:ribose 5-phosphate isomerase B|nr:MAG: RpiB/LacA/LacB family sugar-phosphate isomerase [Candidatus Omnitrophota bacterium]